MLYYFIKYQTIVQSFFKYFGIDITQFTDFERSVIILLANILGMLIIILFLSIVYKFLCRFFRALSRM